MNKKISGVQNKNSFALEKNSGAKNKKRFLEFEKWGDGGRAFRRGDKYYFEKPGEAPVEMGKFWCRVYEALELELEKIKRRNHRG